MAKFMIAAVLFLASHFCISCCLQTTNSCDGDSSCKCYNDVGCFYNRDECDENSLSILPESPEKIGTKFFLYRSVDPTVGNLISHDPTATELVNAGFDHNKETKFIIHGFINSAESNGITDIRDAFLAQNDYNVIMVDWKTGADIGFDDIVKFWTIYRQASQNTRVVAKQLSLLLQRLNQRVGLQFGDVHLIGHSLGAQTAGLAAQDINQGSPVIARITGLDPAKPNFEDKNPACRLDASDALFVDVLHTDTNKFGTLDESGHIDFWPNGGGEQSGCIILGCSHGRSMEYFAFSILGKCAYISHPCDGSSCSDCPLMGIDADKSSSRGNFCLTTTSKSPYC